MNVLEETNKELPNFNVDYDFNEDDLAVLLASESNKPPPKSKARNRVVRTLRSRLPVYRVRIFELGLFGGIFLRFCFWWGFQ